MAETIEQLRSMSREELIEHHDRHAQHTVVGTGHYLAELARRDTDEQTKTMIRLTAAITRLTYVIAALTLISVVAVLVDVL